MAKLVSKTYGEALFDLAVEENKIDSFLEQAQLLKEVLKDNPEFSVLLNHPKVMKEEKITVLNNVFADRLSKEIVAFLEVIIKKDRYSEIDSILDYFIDQVKELKGIGIVLVTTAIELNEAQKNKIEKRLLDTTKYNSLEMHFKVDISLISGMQIRIGDRGVDSSVATKLNDLQKQLLKIQLA